MTEVFFYACPASSSDIRLIQLIEMCRSRSWNVQVRCATQERMEALDSYLWTYEDDSFLPHTTADSSFSSGQPVVLTTGLENDNQARVCFLVDSLPLPDPLDEFRRTVIIFSLRNEPACDHARLLWRQVRDLGINVAFWQWQSGSGWKKRDPAIAKAP